MRLLHTKTRKFEEFFNSQVPRYYVLSHRWTRDEISFKEYSKGRNLHSAGYKKVDAFCKLVQRHHGPSWIWVDTICIDKRSSAELTEAINSMWDWYWRAEICYAYLADVKISLDLSSLPLHLNEQEQNRYIPLQQSEWFTRGWTLQELLAPECVEFLDCDWKFVGRKGRGREFNAIVSEATGIEEIYLTRRDSISRTSIACRIIWAAKRKTTRKEDEAYCLMGLLDVNMPLLYGEGNRAFRRLQEELIRTSNDQSVFAWKIRVPRVNTDISVIARNPSDFTGCDHITRMREYETPCTMEMTNRGVRVQGNIRRYLLNFRAFVARLTQDNIMYGSNRYEAVLPKYWNTCNDYGQLPLLGVPLSCHDSPSWFGKINETREGSHPLEFKLILVRLKSGENRWRERWEKFAIDRYLPRCQDLLEDVTTEREGSQSTTLMVQT